MTASNTSIQWVFIYSNLLVDINIFDVMSTMNIAHNVDSKIVYTRSVRESNSNKNGPISKGINANDNTVKANSPRDSNLFRIRSLESFLESTQVSSSRFLFVVILFS